MNDVVQRFQIELEQIDRYEFKVRFDKEQYENLYIDEPAPLGNDEAPNAVRVLAAAIGNCLSASLLFCLQKNGVKLSGLRSTVDVEMGRNETGRMRVTKTRVLLQPPLAPDDPVLQRCLPAFEDFCTVTQSVRDGIEVDVVVEPTEVEVGV